MKDDALGRLIELCPPPPRPLGARGDRAAARAAAGWPVPDHVLDVIEAYGGARWMDWLHLPSPHVPSDREAIAQRNGSHPTLIGFTDPEEALLFTDERGVVVLGATDEVHTERTLAEVLLGWLSGQETFGLPTVAELTEDPELRPFAVPGWDAGRKSSLKVVRVPEGAAARADRWAAFAAAIGPHVPMRRGDGTEKAQDRIYLPELEAEILFDSYSGPSAERLHLSFYLDRQGEVDARIEAALAAVAAGRGAAESGKKSAAKKTAAASATGAATRATKAKTPKAAKVPRGPGALAALLERATLPADGWGLSRAPRLGVSPTIDGFLGLGFPHLLATTDDPLPDYDTARKVFGTSPSAPLGHVIPRELVARRYAMLRAVPDDAHLRKAFEAPGTLRLEDEIAPVLKLGTRLHVEALEAMFGSAPVADALVQALSRAPVAGWQEPLDRAGWNVIRALGWVLCRVPAAQRTKLRGVLEETFARVSASDGRGWRSHKALDVILHGRAGVERSGGRAANRPDGALAFSDLAFVDDDRDWLIDTVTQQLAVLRPADRAHFDPQLVVQGGAPVLAAFRASTGKFLKETRPAMEAMLALFA